jgi:hypothetical protein
MSCKADQQPVLCCAYGATVKDQRDTIIRGSGLVLRNVYGCCIFGRHNNVTGDDNEVTGDDCVVRGDRNTLRGVRFHVTGSENDLDGHFSLLIGPSNSMKGHNNTQIIRSRNQKRRTVVVRERSRSPVL